MTTCDLCGHADPADLYQRTPAAWRCRSGTGCETRQLTPDLGPSVDDYPEVGTSRFTGLMHTERALGAQVVEPGHDDKRNPFLV